MLAWLKSKKQVASGLLGIEIGPEGIALAHVADLNQRIAELTEMRDTLAHLAQSCHGDDKPDCPILQSLGLAGDTEEKACCH